MTSAGFEVEPLQPFRLDLTALALHRRRNNRIDLWDGTTLRRVLPASASGGAVDTPFLLDVTRAEPASTRDRLICVTATGSAGRNALEAAGRRAVRDLLSTDLDLSAFYAMAATDARLAPLAKRMEGLKPPRYPGLFEGLLNAIPCQQMTLSFGLQLVERLARRFGSTAFESGGNGPLGLPRPESLAVAAADTIGAMGFSRTKARALIELAREVVAGNLDLEALAELPDAEVQRRLSSLYGVGRWTSEYVLLRALGRLNVFPDGDSGARNGLARFLGEAGKPSYEWVAERVAPWAPYSGFVYLHLLVDGLTRADPGGELHGPLGSS